MSAQPVNVVDGLSDIACVLAGPAAEKLDAIIDAVRELIEAADAFRCDTDNAVAWDVLTAALARCKGGAA